MLHGLQVIVEVNVVDDVMSVHVMHLLLTVFRLTRMSELTDQGGFWACGKLPWGVPGWLFLHRSDVWMMRKFFFSPDGTFGGVGLYVKTKGILSLSVRDLTFLCKAFDLGVSKTLSIAA